MNNSLLLHPFPGSVPAQEPRFSSLCWTGAIGVLVALLTLPAAPEIGQRAILQFVAAASALLAGYLWTLPSRFPGRLSRRRFASFAAAGAGLLAAALFETAAYQALGIPFADPYDLAVYIGFLGLALAFVRTRADHRRSRRELAASLAQARSLESQIRPHFFFNTLNTVSAIIPDQPAEAQRILGQFANLFRGAMAGSDGQPVPLSTELDLVRDYLDIERARFGARLRFNLPDSAPAADLHIPPLTLQPIVENAVRHGIAQLLDGGEITVSLSLHPEHYEVVVTNPVDEPPALSNETLLPPGHSLRLVAERLELLYGRRASIKASLAERRFQLTLHLPRTKN